MRYWFDLIMGRRANSLTQRLRKWVASGDRVADIGSGTGHNAQIWRDRLQVSVDEFDIADIHWVGSGPVIFNGEIIPASDAAYDVVVVLFVLHYASDPVNLMQEVRRICARHVIVIQSTYRGTWGRIWLSVRELLWGPVAFYLARFTGMIRSQSCPVISTGIYSREEMNQLFDLAGLTIHYREPQEWWGLSISRDLYVLEPASHSAMCPSSSPPVTKSAGCPKRL